MTEPTVTRTIEITGLSKCFYQGITAADKVLESFAEMGAYDERLLALWWFYVGSIAVSEYGITSQAEQEAFLRGVSCRAPHLPTHDDKQGKAIDAILKQVEAAHPTAETIRFTTTEHDNGYWFHNRCQVSLADDTTVGFELPDGHGLSIFGQAGRHSVIIIDVENEDIMWDLSNI